MSKPLAHITQEAARSFVVADIRGVELAAGATTEVDVLDIPAGASVGIIKTKLKEEFGGETAVVTALTAQVGDEDDADGFIAAKSVLDDNSPVAAAQSDGVYANSGTDSAPGVFKLYPAAKTLKVKFTKTGAGNATALFTTGRLQLTVEIIA